MSLEPSFLTSKAGPRDAGWPDRLAEEYESLLEYVEKLKASEEDFFTIESDDLGTKWFGKCWIFHFHQKREFAFEIEIPSLYPTAPPEIKIPELEGKTVKMYRGGIICTSDHFEPLWKRKAPSFGISHALKLGLAPWLSVEIPDILNRTETLQ